MVMISLKMGRISDDTRDEHQRLQGEQDTQEDRLDNLPGLDIGLKSPLLCQGL